jgi:hypothetical protein
VIWPPAHQWPAEYHGLSLKDHEEESSKKIVKTNNQEGVFTP